MSNFITGGCGFVGSYLTRRIGGTVYDNLSVPNAVMPKKRGWEADIRDMNTLVIAMNGHSVVWHLAASGDIAVGMKDTAQDLNNNTVGTRNVLEAMRLNGISKIVFSSSATYYGNQEGMMKEDMPPAAISLYGASKVAGEALIKAYSHLFGIQAWVFRFGNVVGGSMGRGVIYDFINKLKKNPHRLEIIGDGKQEKPYFLVEDCVDGMICGLKYPPDTYNLAPMTFTIVDDIAKIVIEEMGLHNVKLIHTEKPKWDVPIVKLNSDKIQKLGWKPSHTSDEAVRIATRRLLQ